jgi:hypothetical protein
LFGHVHIRPTTYIYLFTSLFFIWKYRTEIIHSLRSAIKELVTLPKTILGAVVIAGFFQLYAHVGSGFLGPKGLGIYFVNAADGMMHLSYIQSMTTHFPPIEPGYAGMDLLNYHYWSDLVISEFARVWLLPITHLFFQYIQWRLYSIHFVAVVN